MAPACWGSPGSRSGRPARPIRPAAGPQRPDAARFHQLDYGELLRRELRFQDPTAVSLCAGNDLPIVVFYLMRAGNVVRAVPGERIGTLVSRFAR